MSSLPAALGPQRRLGRLPYFLIGVVLLLLKHALDAGVARFLFHRPWEFFHYFVLPGETVKLLDLRPDDRWFYGTLLGLALPFICLGVTLTVRRLRDAGLPAALVILFFIPLVNILFFLLLSVLPGRKEESPVPTPPPDSVQHAPISGSGGVLAGAGEEYLRSERWRRLRLAHLRLTRNSALGSGLLSLAISVPVAMLFIVLATNYLGSYGWGLFVGMPFCLGLGSVVLFGLTKPQPFSTCMLVATGAAAVVFLGMLFFAMEGAICLIMAAPIGFVLVALGGIVGYAIQARPWSTEDNLWSVRDNLSTFLLLVCLLPALTAAEAAQHPEPPLLEVTTTVDIDAPAQCVWRQVLSFPELAEPQEWLFRCGVAYPMRAEILGHGPGAVRHCIFSTGAFVEPIEVWDEPRELSFSVAEQPEPMREWSPYAIHPPHLDHYLVSHRGRFLLTALPDGRTRLAGTTWYTNRMWPESYWQLWSDSILHRIHGRVLEHIKHLAEAEASANRALRK
jgi:uncharacterized membrane protein YhaH (DUF805 family)